MKGLKLKVTNLLDLFRGRKPILAVGLPVEMIPQTNFICDMLKKQIGKDYHILAYTDRNDGIKLDVLNSRNIGKEISLPEIHYMIEKRIKGQEAKVIPFNKKLN
jgi:hypothetical protein